MNKTFSSIKWGAPTQEFQTQCNRTYTTVGHLQPALGTTLATPPTQMQLTRSLDIPEACTGWDTYMQASPLSPVPQPYNPVVGGACGQQVVAICLQAV